ncbi:MAG: hypothetical protein ACOCRK_02050 [bacterium]
MTIKKHIFESDFKFTSSSLIDLAYIYGEVVSIFKHIVFDDLDNILKFKYDNINTRIAIKESLIKTPKSILTNPKPILSLNTRMDTDYEGDVLSALPYNTDLSHLMDVRMFSDPFIISHNRNDNKQNIAVSFSFKRIKLTIEANIIDDYRSKLINLYHYWKTKRYPGRLYRKTVVIPFPIPHDVYLEYSKAHDLDHQDIESVYHHIKKQSFFPVELKRNLGNGNQEIFLKYETFLDYTAMGFNLTDGVRKGNITTDFMLTRPFEIVVNVPSMCFIRLDRPRMFVTNDAEIPPSDSLEIDVRDWVRYDWKQYEDEDYKQIINADYRFERAEETIDCKGLLYDDFSDFYEFLTNRKGKQKITPIEYDIPYPIEYDINEDTAKLMVGDKENDYSIDYDNNTITFLSTGNLIVDGSNEYTLYFDYSMDVENYIKIKYFKGEEINMDRTYIIDHQKLTIEEKSANFGSNYNIGIYVKLGFYNEWLENVKYKEE